MQNALLGHSVILLTCIKRYSLLKTKFGLLSVWPLKTSFAVLLLPTNHVNETINIHSKEISL